MVRVFEKKLKRDNPPIEIERLSPLFGFGMMIIVTLMMILVLSNACGLEIGWLPANHEMKAPIQTDINVLQEEEFLFVTWYQEDDFPDGWYWNSTETNETVYSEANYTFFLRQSDLASSIIDCPFPSNIQSTISVDDLPIDHLHTDQVFDVVCSWTSRDTVMYLNTTLSLNVTKGFDHSHYVPDPVAQNDRTVFINITTYEDLKSISVEIIVRGHLGIDRAMYNLTNVTPSNYSFSGQLFYVDTDEPHPIDKIVLVMRIVMKSGYVFMTTFSGDNYVSISPDFKSTVSGSEESKPPDWSGHIAISVLILAGIAILILWKKNGHSTNPPRKRIR